jgi:hypothetical protein
METPHAPVLPIEVVPLDALPRGSRIWVFAANRDLAPADEARLAVVVDRVFGVWAKKSQGARGAFGFLEGRFLVVGADEREACISGCGIDAMMQWIKQLETESGLRLVDRMQVFWRDAAGGVRNAHRVEFKRLLEAGEATSATHVFDTAAATSDVLAEGRFELPLSESWHSKVFLGAG